MHLLTIIALQSALAGVLAAPVSNDYLVRDRSKLESCTDFSVDENGRTMAFLHAECHGFDDETGEWDKVETGLDLNKCMANVNGHLEKRKNGNFASGCRAMKVEVDDSDAVVFTAGCDGWPHYGTIDTSIDLAITAKTAEQFEKLRQDHAAKKSTKRVLARKLERLRLKELEWMDQTEAWIEERRIMRRSNRTYPVVLVNKVKALMGVNYNTGKMVPRLRKWASGVSKPVTLQTLDKFIAQTQKYKRQVKMYRMWFLDLHTMKDLSLILQHLDDNTPLDWALRTLQTRLRQTMRKMEAITCGRHVAEAGEARRALFKILPSLQRYESRYLEKRRELFWMPPFPCFRLRTAETNLLEAEVLCMELVVRKALIEGPKIEMDTLTKLRKLGYKPKFSALPCTEPDIDID
ncbi:hypothetical protein F5B21DRAFT_519880 [Xylaria acuta]|nr:hypothetical protein F5B21DRAFT_519880 [Xylaria acuta]